MLALDQKSSQPNGRLPMTGVVFRERHPLVTAVLGSRYSQQWLCWATLLAAILIAALVGEFAGGSLRHP